MTRRYLLFALLALVPLACRRTTYVADDRGRFEPPVPMNANEEWVFEFEPQADGGMLVTKAQLRGRR